MMLHLQYSALPAAAVITPRVCKAPCRASNPRLSYGQINVGVLPWHHGRIRLLAGGAIVGERPQATICLSTLTQAQARRSRHEDDSVEFDDDNSWQGQGRGSPGLVPSIAGPVLLAANGLSEKLTDVACDLAPSNIERGTVEIAVKAGLVLVAVGIARSLLGIALTIGTVLFGLYVATKIWSKPGYQGPTARRNRSQQRRRQQSRQDDDGLSEVWFESKPQRKSSRKTQDDDFW